MKKIALTLVILMTLALLTPLFAGCTGSGTTSTDPKPSGTTSTDPKPTDTSATTLSPESTTADNTPTGSLSDIYKSVIDAAKAAAPSANIPLTPFDDPIDSGNVKNKTGLTWAQYEQYIAEGYYEDSGMMLGVYYAVILKLKNPSDATTVKNLITSGYDPMQKICVGPEKCFLISSGSYLFLVTGTQAQCNAVYNAFGTKFPGAAANVFYTKP